ncbi:MAG: carbohydrate-binding family 9-like protein [Bacteroidales bacterium]
MSHSSMDASINPEPGYLKIKRTADFDISGDGSSSAWNIAEWEIIPNRSMNIVDYTTKARILYSGTGIYFLFHCEDEVISATLQADNLDLWKEDVIEVFLMPDKNSSLYFEYQLSPLNYELTLLIPNLDGDRRFLGWLPWKYEGDRKTHHETTILKDESGEVKGWTAEFFIPWNLLDPLIKEPPQSGDEWKANIYRLDYDRGTARFTWQKTDRHFHEPHNFGIFVFE